MPLNQAGSSGSQRLGPLQPCKDGFLFAWKFRFGLCCFSSVFTDNSRICLERVQRTQWQTCRMVRMCVPFLQVGRTARDCGTQLLQSCGVTSLQALLGSPSPRGHTKEETPPSTALSFSTHYRKARQHRVKSCHWAPCKIPHHSSVMPGMLSVCALWGVCGVCSVSVWGVQSGGAVFNGSSEPPQSYNLRETVKGISFSSITAMGAW